MVLSGALKQAVKERIIPFNPCDNCRIPKKEKKEMTILPPEKIGEYLDEAKRLGVYEMFFLELTSGLRRGELLALLWTDLDVENNIMTRKGCSLRCKEIPVSEIRRKRAGSPPGD